MLNLADGRPLEPYRHLERDMTEAELENAFLSTAIEYSECLNKNVKKANRAVDHVHRLKDQLRLLPDRGEAALKRICTHHDVEIKILASAALLAIDEPFALQLLGTIAQSEGLSSFTAEMTIREWKAGNLARYWA
jgi:hypothetical protein